MLQSSLYQKNYKESEKGKITQEKYYHSEAKREATRRWKQKYPEKNRVHVRTYLAIKKGLLIRGVCEFCGNIKALAHHDDYSKPLEVRWMCNLHHCEYHKSKEVEYGQ